MGTAKVKLPEKFDEVEENERCYLPKRYILTVLSFLGVLIIYAMRVNLSVAMVAIVNRTTTEVHSDSSHSDVECPNLISKSSSTENEKFIGEQYNWSTEEQGFILGAFFYGYIITQLPAGLLSEKFGAKWLFGGGCFITSILTLFAPLAASWGIVCLIIVRILQGLGEGLTFPAMNLLISKWSPKLERSRISTMVYAGVSIGNVISMPISGWLCSMDFLGGWPSAFYVFGIAGVIWFLFWAVLICESPSEHPSISIKELKYFEMDISSKKCKTPWKAIITSLPVWAVVVAQTGYMFGFLILLTELPTYLGTILHFNIKHNGLLSALPFTVLAVSAWVASFIADKLRRSNILSITNIRKLSNSIGLFGPAICLLGVTQSGCNPQLIIALLSLSMAANGFVYSGFNVTYVDMSPAFAATLYAIASTISNLNGIIGPAIVGFFTSKEATIANWNKVFYIAAAIYTLTGAFFVAFASAELQPWGQEEKESEKDIPGKDISTIDSKS